MDLHNEFENSRFFNQARSDRRTTDVMVGVVIGIIGDGVASQAEAEFLLTWLQINLPHMDDPVVNLLHDRLSNMLANGSLDPAESVELMTLLEQFAGIDLDTAKPKVATVSNQLPLNHPAPELEFSGKTFLFTGVMAFGHVRRVRSW